jgi:hypothetical protein
MTQVRSEFRPLFRNLFIAGVFVFLLAGCSSPNDHIVGKVPEHDEVRPVAMMGEEKFFNGRITAMVTVSQGLDGLARRGGWRTLGKTRAEAPELQEVFSRELGDPEKNDINQTINKMIALQVTGSPLPPVLLRIQLSNAGTDPVEVTFDLFKSYLGDFAVRPSTVTVPAAGTTSPEGMSSRLGVTSNEIPVQLTLSVDGKPESRTILVKNVVVDPATPSAAQAPAKK